MLGLHFLNPVPLRMIHWFPKVRCLDRIKSGSLGMHNEQLLIGPQKITNLLHWNNELW